MKTNNDTIDFAKKALKCRLVEEKLLDLFKTGHLSGTVHTSIGQEITPVILSKYLTKHDYKFSNHRGHSHYLALTNDEKGLICELLGNTEGCSGGYGGSQHLYNQEYNFYSNGIQGGMAPIAVGAALSKKLKNENSISCIFIGDGTLGQGVLYEALNFAGINNIPILIICEDNGIAQSTDTSQFNLQNLKNRIVGFGCEYLESNTNDWNDLEENIKKSVELARKNQPTFLRVKTNRLMSHSKGDDNRDVSYIESLVESDNLNKYLINYENFKLFKKNYEKELADNVKTYINYEKLLNPKKNDLIKIEQFEYVDLESNNLTVRKNINKNLKEILNRRGVILGEDIRDYNGDFLIDYGGAFKVTNGLTNLDNERVLNSPIAEQAIIGISTGMALDGTIASAEIMFGDFMTLTVDQIAQHISKFRVMFGKNIELPILVRTPMGGRRGYGPTHSQSLERLFLGIPEITLSSVNKYSNMDLVYKITLDEKIPQLCFEHKLNYNSKNSILLNNYNYSITNDYNQILKISPKLSEPKITIFTYGYNLELIEEYLDKSNTTAEVICPTVISPLNILPLVKSILTTGKLFIFEEGSDLFGLSAAVTHYLSKNKISYELVGSFGNSDVIPSSIEAEIKLLNGYYNELENAFNE